MNTKHILASRILALALFAATPCAFAQSGVPNSMSYQGRISDANGNLVGNPTPVNRTVIFRVWDNPTATAPANLLYSEQQIVTIASGEFNVLVGQGLQVGTEPKPAFDTVFNGAQRFLGVTVDDGTAAVDPEIAPRQQLVTSAFAFRARTAEGVTANAITSSMLAAGAVTPISIAPNAIDSTKLATGAVTAASVAAGAVATASIADNAIDSSKLAAGAVTNAKIADNSITAAKIAASSIDSARIVDGTITNADLANGSVSSAKLDGSIALWGASGGNFFRTTGNVGIGTNNPLAKLDVVGGSQITMNHNLADWSLSINPDNGYQLNWSTGQPSSNRSYTGTGAFGTLNAYYQPDPFTNPSLIAPRSLTTTFGIRSELLVGSGQGFVTYSDRRIKRDIRTSKTADDLAAIEKLQVSDYRMVDPADDGMAWRKGFIAQEVEKVIPGAIARSREFIPDIFSLATATAYDPATKSLSLTLEKDHDLKVGEHVRLHVDGKRLDRQVSAVPSAREFLVGDCESAPEKVFVYGRQVDDFRTVDYDRIFTTSVGALQELKKQKDAEVKSLRDENAALRDRLAALEANRKTLDAKLAALETLVRSIKPPEVRTVSLKAAE